jgi:hypothetical protein
MRTIGKLTNRIPLVVSIIFPVFPSPSLYEVLTRVTGEAVKL